MTKVCTSCEVYKALTEFPQFQGVGGEARYRAVCKTCWATRQRARRMAMDPIKRKAQSNRKHLKRAYNLTPAEHQEMVDERNGKCDICGQDDKRLHVDHDHDTGVVRGMLCFKCNVSLGHFNDSVDVLQQAIKYLEGSTCRVS